MEKQSKLSLKSTSSMSGKESAMVFPFFCLLHLQQWHNSLRYGPSIYTVNEQYIKPVTCDAGKVSWALMRNPKGLDCDLFISHAWQEGIFEFLRKVRPFDCRWLKMGTFYFLFLVFLVWINAFGMESVFKNPVRHSWPRGVRNAWCCMLANPQNLDIGEMLQTPSDSPFAAALRASKIVLVVPNRHCSVYTRLWCGYEAFLAHEEGKTILIAKDSNLQEIRRLGFAFSIFYFVFSCLRRKVSILSPNHRSHFQVFFCQMHRSHCCVAWGGHSYAWLWLWWLE